MVRLHYTFFFRLCLAVRHGSYHYFQCNGIWIFSSKLEELRHASQSLMKIKAIYKDTLCCFMHVNKATPLMKVTSFKRKRHFLPSLLIPKNRRNYEMQTHFRVISLSAIHHQSSVLIFQHSSATLMHQYQQLKNGQPVKIQELRIFLQTKTVRSSDTDKMHFSNCWLTLCQMQANISFRTKILQTDIQPYPLIFKISPRAIPAKLWTTT